MTLNLLGKNIIKKSEVTVINGQIIYKQYNLINEIFLKYCPDIKLAEPVFSENEDESNLFVSWYIDTKVEPKTISEIQKKEIYQQIEKNINYLLEIFPKTSSKRQLINAVLTVQNKNDILIEQEKIIIKNWGVEPYLDAKKNGLYLLDLMNLFSEAKPSLHNQKSEQADNISKKNENENLLNQKTDFNYFPNKVFNINHYFNIYYNLSRVIAGILFFLIGLFLGWRLIFAERPVKIMGLTVLQAQDLMTQQPNIDYKNKILENEIIALQEKLKKPPCNIKESRADPSLNKSMDQPYTPMTANGQQFQGSLPELLEKSTVFIMVLRNDNVSVASGTGFFITPDTIITNRHVVEKAKNNSVMVTNQSLGQLKLAHIVLISQYSQIGGLDLAVLKIENAPPQQPLSFSLEAKPLQDVVAAGYPGIMISQDDAMQRLLKGDLRAIPGVILTKGQINGIQRNHEGEIIMPHSAMVSPGNSGGPLVDLCGRVVGVNTFVTMDQDTSSHGNYAQKSDLIVQILQASQIPIQVQSGACKSDVADEKKNDNFDQSLSKKSANLSDKDTSLPSVKVSLEKGK